MSNIGGMPWFYRPETNDMGIIEQVFENNACHLPDNMDELTFLDIGAHIGAASVLAASRGAKVIAYEPGSGNYQVLLANINRGDFNIVPHHLGIGEPGIKKLYLDDYNTGQNSEHVMYPELNKEHFEYMRVVTLEEAMSGRDVSFLKMDCEGCEEEVISQIAAGLHSGIDSMYIEFHSDRRRACIDKLKSFYEVRNMGYGYMFL